MMHPKIFFRNSEYELLMNNYNKTTDSISKQVEAHFLNTQTIEDLYLRVNMLKNAERIKSNFDSKISHGYLERGTSLDPRKGIHNLTPQDMYGINFSGSQFIFYFTIFIFFTFIFSLIKKYKVLAKITFLSFLGLIAFNLYNYYVVEPEILSDYKDIDYEEYTNTEYHYAACDIFDKLYDSSYKPESNSVSSNNDKNYYNYDVTGEDENGNNVIGSINVDNEYGGNGYLTDSNNNQIEVSVEWIGNGELKGTDSQGNNYRLHTD